MITVDKEVQRLVRDELDREQAARMERIRQAVVERQAMELAAHERQQHIGELRERIPVELDTAPLEAVRAELAEVLDRYVAACADYDRRFAACWTDLLNLAGSGPLPADLSASNAHGGMISSAGRDIRKSRLHITMITLAEAVIRKHRPPDRVDLHRAPQD